MKKKGCSHLHSFWLTENIVEQAGSLKLKKYKDKINDKDEKANEEEELFHTTDYCKIERIIGIKKPLLCLK